MVLSVILAVLFVIALSAFVRAAVGFGDALLAMPLLTLLVGLQLATPLVGIASLLMSIVVLATSWRSLNLAAGWRLIAASALGAPVGLWLFTNTEAWIMQRTLGLILVGYGLYNLLRPGLPPLQREGWAFPFGFVAGILGSAYNTSGPPVIIYGAMRRWPPDTFRATLQGFFLINGIMIAAGHALANLWTTQVLQIALFSVPAIAIGILAGIAARRRIAPETFSRLVYLMLVALGLLFLAPL
jgi:uncharacterized membrane protein YfcA